MNENRFIVVTPWGNAGRKMAVNPYFIDRVTERDRADQYNGKRTDIHFTDGHGFTVYETFEEVMKLIKEGQNE